MKPEVIHTLHEPLRLQAGVRYPPMEVRLADDFAFTSREIVGPALTYLGAVYAPAGAHGIELPFLRVVGFPEGWNPRLSQNSSTDWRINLWELAGLHLYGALGVRIGHLEVDGLPRGFVAQGSPGYSLDSGYFRRCGKPIDSRFNVVDGLTPTGFSLRHIVQVDGRLDRGLDPKDQWRAKTARIANDWTSGKAGSYVNGEQYEVVGLVQHGDSFGLKCSGSRYLIRNIHAAHLFVNGSVPDNLTLYPGTEYRHLHESRDVVLEDFRLVGSAAAFVDNALLRVSYPFDPELTVRRGVFVRGAQATHAAIINWASVAFEDSTFIGWPDAAAAFLLGAAGQGMPGASVRTNQCRFYPS